LRSALKPCADSLGDVSAFGLSLDRSGAWLLAKRVQPVTALRGELLRLAARLHRRGADCAIQVSEITDSMARPI